MNSSIYSSNVISDFDMSFKIGSLIYAFLLNRNFEFKLCKTVDKSFYFYLCFPCQVKSLEIYDDPIDYIYLLLLT